MNNSTIEKIKKIKLIAMDIDGVLTTGDIIILDSGEELKIFNSKDRFGIMMARKAGLKLAWISGRGSKQVQNTAHELGIESLTLDCKEKLKPFNAVLKSFNLSHDDAAYIGDDLIDLPVIRKAGFSACPHDACKQVKESADYITSVASGKGAVREIIDLILQTQGVWDEVTQEYYK